jgi:hypothetical protein
MAKAMTLPVLATALAMLVTLAAAGAQRHSYLGSWQRVPLDPARSRRSMTPQANKA